MKLQNLDAAMKQKMETSATHDHRIESERNGTTDLNTLFILRILNTSWLSQRAAED